MTLGRGTLFDPVGALTLIFHFSVSSTPTTLKSFPVSPALPPSHPANLPHFTILTDGPFPFSADSGASLSPGFPVSMWKLENVTSPLWAPLAWPAKWG